MTLKIRVKRSAVSSPSTSKHALTSAVSLALKLAGFSSGLEADADTYLVFF